MQGKIVSQDRADFELWQSGGAESSKIRPELVADVINERLSDTQKEYITCYYYGMMKMPEIAKKYGVATSTVSRTIARGKRRIRDALKYCVRS